MTYSVPRARPARVSKFELCADKYGGKRERCIQLTMRTVRYSTRDYQDCERHCMCAVCCTFIPNKVHNRQDDEPGMSWPVRTSSSVNEGTKVNVVLLKLGF